MKKIFFALFLVGLVAAGCYIQAPGEDALLNGLTPEAKIFFKRSIEIRKSYVEANAYKNFQRDRDRDGKIDAMDQYGYLHLKTENPISNNYTPNPDLYGDSIPKEIPAVFYRYVKDCKTRETIERQIIDTTAGYQNYIGGDRYEQQCILDDSADQYYLESKTKLE